MARFDNNLPLESVLSRKTREGVDGESKVSAVTGADASGFFPEARTGVFAGGLTRAEGKDGVLEGTTDGVNGVADDRQGTAAASVPNVVAHTGDRDADGRLNYDPDGAGALVADADDTDPNV